MLTRRELLRAAGLVTAATAFPVRMARAQSAATETITLQTTVVGVGTYTYLPFAVPAGVNRIDVVMEESYPQSTPAYPTNTALGIGLFDQRGPGYQSAGFRGVYGEEFNEFFLTASEASLGFIPGPIEAGTWTVIVPVFRAPQPTDVTITITLTFGPRGPLFVPGPTQRVVTPEAGWYRGDLHWHTIHSSDARNSGSALAPDGVADACRQAGLDFAALTDHNVVSQNFHLARDAGPDVLLMGGEEMTNWFHGHATVSGLDPLEWLDWRQRPEGVPLMQHEARIQEFLGVSRELGAYTSAAHPMFAHLSWHFFADAAADRDALPEGIEIWTGSWTPDCEAALTYWDSQLQQGVPLWANGGSDLHGVDNDQGFFIGTPTTVVWARALSTPAVVEALSNGRAFVTRVPDGVEVYLNATGPDDQQAMVGGTIYGSPTDVADVTVTVRKATGMRLRFVANGLATERPVTSDDQTFAFPIPIGTGGYVRAEVRGEPFLDPSAPLGSRGDMEAFTNPILLVNGAPPDDEPPPAAPPPDRERHPAPDGSGPARLPDTGGGLAVAGAAATGLAAALARIGRPAHDTRRPVPMSLSEVAHRAAHGGALAGLALHVLAEVVAVEAEGTVVQRVLPGCCSHHGPGVEMLLVGDVPVTRPGEWLEVVGTWRDGTGADRHDRPVIEIQRAAPAPPPDDPIDAAPALPSSVLAGATSGTR